MIAEFSSRSSKSSSSELEINARNALSRAICDCMNDSEWEHQRDCLLDYVKLLRSWDANERKRSAQVRIDDRATK